MLCRAAAAGHAAAMHGRDSTASPSASVVRCHGALFFLSTNFSSDVMLLAPCEFAENASTIQRRFPYPPRAPNKAFKAAIADQPRYLVSHKGKDERALHAEGPCHVPRLQFSRTEKTQEVFVHARQQPPTRSVSLLQRPPSLLSTNPNAGEPLRSVWTFRPMVGWTNSQDKRISHAPLLMEVSEVASHIHLARTCGEIGFHERSRFPTRGRTPRLGRLASRDALSFVDMISLERTWAPSYD